MSSGQEDRDLYKSQALEANKHKAKTKQLLLQHKQHYCRCASCLKGHKWVPLWLPKEPLNAKARRKEKMFFKNSKGQSVKTEQDERLTSEE